MQIHENQQIFSIKAGNIAIIPPSHTLRLESSSDADGIALHIGLELIGRILSRLPDDYYEVFATLPFMEMNDFVIEQFVKNIQDLIDQDNHATKLQAEYLACAITNNIILRHFNQLNKQTIAPKGLPQSILDKTLNAIDGSLGEKISVEDIAKNSGFGAAQFSRLFKQSFGHTFHQIVIRKRIQRAQFYLSQTTMPIITIVHECGFADQMHLTRLFKRFIGMSPAAFRREKSN